MASVDVPTSWQQVTLRQFMALRELGREDGPAEEKVYATISIMTGADPDNIRTWSMGTLDRVWAALDFLKHPELIGGKRVSPVKLLGKKYNVIIQPKQLCFGAFVDLMHFVKDEKTAEANLHKAFGCCLVECKRWPWSKEKEYNGKAHEVISEAVLDLPITTVKPYTDFFLRNYLAYSKRMVIYFRIMKAMLRIKARFLKSTAG